jgi:hypothetical protein
MGYDINHPADIKASALDLPVSDGDRETFSPVPAGPDDDCGSQVLRRLALLRLDGWRFFDQSAGLDVHLVWHSGLEILGGDSQRL